jgi:thioredoxin 1
MSYTIIKFWGNGCMNCKTILPILDEVKKEYPNISFKDINTSEDDEAAEKYQITSLPTLVFEKDGQVVGKLVGLKPKSLILKKIDEVF